MNWYVIYCHSQKAVRICQKLNAKQGVKAMIPKMEYWRRDCKSYEMKPMFPGYVFVCSTMDQKEFTVLISNLYQEMSGMIRQLTHEDTTALTEEEIKMFQKLLNEEGILVMSKAKIEDGKAVVYEGPLRWFESNIVKVDRHNQLGYLDLSFMDRRIQAGLLITGKV